ncbi:type VI secretion system secreted protein Hcp [Sinobacterium caligoides]|uniref:Type VI secretion system secreted protein Hcp n=1 Tax=Sinobacterium caligoides TaxID=933926 RepID=A0A3N2DJS6_9GAMM|nr:type VI secretion system tube protein Hcp [Sinobacterium caligoides]ROS00051.1 type VI secretion system secreted protein Hcp [Sinobacterium caligoides]
MAIYLNYNAKTPKGNVTAEGYEDWIEIHGMNFGVGRGISMEPGAVSNREATRPSLSEITVSKPMCAASGGLFSQSVTGSEGVKVELHVVKTGGKKLEKYAVITLEDCMISSYSVSASGSGKPQETISISYARIEANLSHADKTNKNPKNQLVGYDLTTAKPL